MFDIGWTEMMVIAVVAIVVVGPKELPGMLRTFGKTMGKVRRMSRDFQRQFDDALREADLDEVRKGFDTVRKANPTNALKKAVSPISDEMTEVGRSARGGTARTSATSKSPETAPSPETTPSAEAEHTEPAKTGDTTT